MKAFISSTYIDLVAYREAVMEALERLGHQAGKMEVFGARPAGAQEICRKEIEQCDLFIGVYAHRYGFIPPESQASITEQEFDHAKDLKKPTFCFILNDDYPWPPKLIEDEPQKSKLSAFKTRMRNTYVLDTFTTADDLAVKVSTSVSKYLSEKDQKDLAVSQQHMKPLIVDINAPAQHVWNTLSDPDRLSEWVPFISNWKQSSEQYPNLIVKSPYFGIESCLTIEEVVRGRELHWVRCFRRLKEDDLSITYSFRIEPIDTSTTRLLHLEVFDGDKVELFWILSLGGLIPRMWARSMNRKLKNLAEGATLTAGE